MKPDDLPLLLAGPAVRRCQPEEVWLWLATSRKPDAVLPSVFEHSFPTSKNVLHQKPTRQIELAEQSREDVRVAQLGTNLFVILLRMRPRIGKFTEAFLRYDLELTVGGQKHTLHALIREKSVEKIYTGVNYFGEGLSRPFFRLPAAGVAIVQGSCRRPGATGKDAFIALDDWLAENLKKLPQALFLTGDQIYADDVAVELFDAVRELAPAVFGTDEPIPYQGRYKPVSSFPWKERKAKVTHTPLGDAWGFTTTDNGHLLGFSEYAAMYLLVWNPYLCWKLNVDRKQNENLKDFTLAVDAARRVMAHLPTYMLFDDHEITDDWYFNSRWKKANLKEPFTRAIIANGLAAYWAFQGWGNAPDSFSDTFKEGIEKHLTHTASAGKLDSQLMEECQKRLFEFADWSFFAPTNPPGVFIDTRTQRRMSRGETPVLVGPAGQTQIRKKSSSAGVGSRPDVLLLVLPGPLLGWNPALIGQRASHLPSDLAEIAQPAMASAMKRFGVTLEMLNNEWEEFWNNEDGIMNVLATVSKIAPRACVVFSGDVHFSYCVDAQCLAVPGVSAFVQTTHFIQITSSPMKNINSKFANYWSLGNVAERKLRKDYSTSGQSGDGVYELSGEAVRLVSGRHEERTSLPDNNVCLVTFRGIEIWAHFLALSPGIGGTLHFSRWFRL